MVKNQANAKQHPEAQLLIFGDFWHSYSCNQPRIIGNILENKQKWKRTSKTGVFVFIRLYHGLVLYLYDYTISHSQNEDENKKGSQRYNINRHGQKYSKY